MYHLNEAYEHSNRANRPIMDAVEAAMTIAIGAHSSHLFSFASVFLGLTAVCLWSVPAQPQQVECPLFAGVVVIGEGNVSAAPDYAQIEAGVTVSASTVCPSSDLRTNG